MSVWGKSVLVLSAGGWVPYLQRGAGLTQIQQVAHVQHLCEDLIVLQGRGQRDGPPPMLN